MVGLKQTDGARIQLDRVSLQGIRSAEVIKELNNLLGSLPQGSDSDGNHVQSKKQVLTKLPCFYQGLQRFVSG